MSGRTIFDMAVRAAADYMAREGVTGSIRFAVVGKRPDGKQANFDVRVSVDSLLRSAEALK